MENIITEKDLPYPNKIRVYNVDFIKENLGWLYDNENGEIKPFALFGSKNIEAAKRIEEINKELGSIDEQTGLYTEHAKQKDNYEKA